MYGIINCGVIMIKIISILFRFLKDKKKMCKRTKEGPERTVSDKALQENLSVTLDNWQLMREKAEYN